MSVTVIVSLKVSDFDQWKTAFDGHAAAREAAGINATAVSYTHLRAHET